MADYSVLSNFGVRYFLMDYKEGTIAEDGKIVINNNALVGTSTDLIGEILDVLECNPGAISKDVKTFKTLNCDGWDSAVPLGQSIGEGSMSLIRTGTGNVFGVTASNDTFNKLKSWMMSATASGGVNAAKALVEVVPRGTAYEATVYRCVPTNFDNGAKTTSDGQEYSISFQAFGKPIPAVATVDSSDNSVSIANPT